MDQGFIRVSNMSTKTWVRADSIEIFENRESNPGTRILMVSGATVFVDEKPDDIINMLAERVSPGADSAKGYQFFDKMFKGTTPDDLEGMPFFERMREVKKIVDQANEQVDPFTVWLEQCIAAGWCSRDVCQNHDMVPLYAEEEAEFEKGYDPCVHVLRLWPDGTPEETT